MDQEYRAIYSTIIWVSPKSWGLSIMFSHIEITSSSFNYRFWLNNISRNTTTSFCAHDKLDPQYYNTKGLVDVSYVGSVFTGKITSNACPWHGNFKSIISTVNFRMGIPECEVYTYSPWKVLNYVLM